MVADKVILLVEDNLINQKLAQKTLALLGYTVRMAVDGAQAVALYKNAVEPFSLVLMDGEMPVLDGFEATKEIRSWELQNARQGVPIIAWTASHEMIKDPDKWLSAGVDDFLPKPFQVTQVKDVLNKWLGKEGEVNQSETKVKIDFSLEAGETELDQQALQQLFELEQNTPGLIQRLVVRYEKQGLQVLQDMENNLRQENSEGIRHAAHTFKSSSASFGATALALCCQQIEQNPTQFNKVEKRLIDAHFLFKQALVAVKQLGV